jgi:hypothetical protein
MVGVVDAYIHYYLKTDPASLSDDDWAVYFNRVKFIKELENKKNNK